jgi:hypothetical protein
VAKNQNAVINKMMKINQLNQERENYLAEQKVTAKKKQEVLSNMI